MWMNGKSGVSSPTELYRKAGKAGLLGIGYPEEYGGSGGDLFVKIAYLEELMRCGSGGVVAGLGSLDISVPPIISLGTVDQKTRFVPPVMRGEKVSALGVTEPDAGSDVANIKTRAVRRGDHYVVNGSKMFITSGARADQLTCAVRTGGEGRTGISLLLIGADTPGYSVSGKLRKMGWVGLGHSSDFSRRLPRPGRKSTRRRRKRILRDHAKL